MDEDEEPGEAAARELEEQTGYAAGQLEHLITFQPVAEVVDGERVVFAGRDPQQVGEPVSAEGIERVEWVPLDSVLELIASGRGVERGFGGRAAERAGTAALSRCWSAIAPLRRI